MDPQELHGFLSQYQYFNHLTDTDLDVLINLSELQMLDENEMLFEAGDATDCAYFVVDGVFIVKEAGSNNKLVGTIKQGEFIGEMGVLSENQRTLSVVSLSQSILFKISSANFIEYMIKRSADILAWFKLVVQRSAVGNSDSISFKTDSTHVLFVNGADLANFNQFKRTLQLSISNKPSCLLVDLDSLWGKYCNSLDKLIDYFDEITHQYNYLFYCLNTDIPLCLRLISHKINSCGFVMDDASEQNIKENILFNRIIQLYGDDSKVRLASISLCDHENESSIVVEEKFSSIQLKIRDLSRDDILRVTRCLTGNSYGLVLSGGDELIWFHVGVLKALYENSIQIDALSATGVGAVVGLTYLVSDTLSDLIGIVHEVNDISLKATQKKTMGKLSLLSAYNNNKMIKKIKNIFSNIRIEQLNIPANIVVFDLSKKKEVIINSGLIWKTLGASISKPGIFPPFQTDEGLYLDGGIVNNLPVDILRTSLGKKSCLIASTQSENLFNKVIQYSNMKEVIAASLVGHSSEKHRENLKISNIHICYDSFNVMTQEELIQLGYIETMKQIDKIVLAKDDIFDS